MAEALRFRTLHASPLVAVREYACGAACGPPGAEEHSEADTIVILRRGAFRRHFGSRSVTADCNQAAFFARGSSYRVSHPAGCGDAGTILQVAPRILGEIVRELDPPAEGRPLPFATGPCETSTWWKHHELLAAPQGNDPLRADVAALQLAADALDAAWRRHARPSRSRRAGTDADHAELTDAAKCWLAAHAFSRVTLQDVAEGVHSSPFHLARVFQRHAGLPIHRYLVRLRLRSALSELADSGDLADLALRHGFSSHAHFTDAFRAEFGRTPSQARVALRSGRRRETSNLPEA